MSEMSALHQHIHKRLREVFGEPSSVLGRDDHWSLKPDRPHAPAINILVNGMAEMPAVWVFDPNVQDDGVMRVAVKDEATLDDTIRKIQERVKQASLPRSVG